MFFYPVFFLSTSMNFSFLNNHENSIEFQVMHNSLENYSSYNIKIVDTTIFTGNFLLQYIVHKNNIISLLKWRFFFFFPSVSENFKIIKQWWLLGSTKHGQNYSWADRSFPIILKTSKVFEISLKFYGFFFFLPLKIFRFFSYVPLISNFDSAPTEHVWNFWWAPYIHANIGGFWEPFYNSNCFLNNGSQYTWMHGALNFSFSGPVTFTCPTAWSGLRQTAFAEFWWAAIHS